MKILWDFRLFSYGYAGRGIGRHTLLTARAILERSPEAQINIWADRKRCPGEMRDWPVSWIPYRSGSWKSDLIRIPVMLTLRRIDLIHYWVALGPLYQIGLGLIHPCPVCATVYDLGVECWEGDPFLASRRKSLFWRVQKILAAHIDQFACISTQTASDVYRVIGISRSALSTIPVPLVSHVTDFTPRQPFFITLGGAPNKNLPTILKGFEVFRQTHPDVGLVVCGDLDEKESESLIGRPGVSHGSMQSYPGHLQRSRGLIFCSRYEGLGLPPLEAMMQGCPLIVSDIAPLRESCGDAARYVDPSDPSDIARGMLDLTTHSEQWATRSAEGGRRYALRGQSAGEQWMNLYRSLCR